MVPFGVRRGRFLRVGLGLITCLLLSCGGDDDRALSDSRLGPVGFSDAQWGALVFRDHGCTGCHSLDASPAPGGSLRGAVHTNAAAEESAESDTPAPDDAPVPHDQSWAEELLLRDAHGTDDGRVSLGLSRDEARALSAFLAATR